MVSDSARLVKVRALLACLDESDMLIHRRVTYQFVLPHNFDQFFIHDCFELSNLQEYPGSRGTVTSRNILEKIPFQWLKAIYGKRRT